MSIIHDVMDKALELRAGGSKLVDSALLEAAAKECTATALVEGAKLAECLAPYQAYRKRMAEEVVQTLAAIMKRGGLA